MDFKFELGARVKDAVTSYRGVVMSRTQFLTGCNRYAVQSERLDRNSGKPDEWYAFDENVLIEDGGRLNIEKEMGNAPAETKKPGGPQDIPAKASIERRDRG